MVKLLYAESQLFFILFLISFCLFLKFLFVVVYFSRRLPIAFVLSIRQLVRRARSTNREHRVSKHRRLVRTRLCFASQFNCICARRRHQRLSERLLWPWFVRHVVIGRLCLCYWLVGARLLFANGGACQQHWFQRHRCRRRSLVVLSDSDRRCHCLHRDIFGRRRSACR